jgi:hypothetical protein
MFHDAPTPMYWHHHRRRRCCCYCHDDEQYDSTNCAWVCASSVQSGNMFLQDQCKTAIPPVCAHDGSLHAPHVQNFGVARSGLLIISMCTCQFVEIHWPTAVPDWCVHYVLPSSTLCKMLFFP